MSTTAAPEEVKVLGQKARARREKELSKRREIVLLDGEPSSEQQKQESIHIAPQVGTKTKRKRNTPKKPHQDTIKAKKKQRPLIRGRGSKDIHQGKTDKLIDSRTPLVSHLTTEEEMQNSSYLVRVHGLPVDARRGDLIRFFAGLDFSQVLLLPTNHSRIVEWDAKENQYQKAKLERQEPTFRVFVKFASGPAASLAAQRSGEILYLRQKGSGEQSESSPKTGATIAVTQVPKRTAKYLLRNMVIECKDNNTLLQDVLTNCEQSVHKLVPKILWSAAKCDLDFTIIEDTEHRWNDKLQYRPLDLLNYDLKQHDPTTAKGYATLVDNHNKMMSDYVELTRGQIPYPSVALCDCPDMLRNSSIQLTTTASKLLLAKSKQIESYLQMARSIARQRPGRLSVFDRLVRGPSDSSTSNEGH